MAQPVPKTRPSRRRWPIIAGGLGAVILVTAGAIAFWPKPPAPIDPVVNNVSAPTEPVGEVRQFRGHDDAIENLAITPDGKRLVTVSKDTTARVWDVATGTELRKLTGHTQTIRGVAVLPDNRRVVTAGWDGTVRLWDLDTGEELRQFSGHTGQVWWVACDAAGERIVTAGQDRSVRVWEVETGQPLKRLLGHFNTATAAVFMPDGRRVVSVSEDRTVRVWDLATRKSTGPPPLSKMIYRMSLSPNGRWVLFGCQKTLYRWDPDGSLHDTPVSSKEPIESAVALPDGRAVLAMLDGTIRVWDFDPDREVHKFAGNGQAVLALAVAPDGRHVASGGRDRVARLWRLPEK